VRRDNDGPRPLGESLRRLAGRVKRVDLVGFAAVEAAWPAVPSSVASGAVPLRLVHGELTVTVSSGAHAARARRDAHAMLDELAASLGEPPRVVRVIVQPS